MKKSVLLTLLCLTGLCFANLGWAQRASPLAPSSLKELSKAELARLIPASYFFAGQTASTQLRNAGGVRFNDGKFLLIALVDNSGYSSGLAQKYQGLLITQVALDFDGSTIEPGSYGFGSPAANHVGILDINANEIAGGATAASPNPRPVPLRLTVGDSGIIVSLNKRSFTLKLKD
ncbi:MAG: hypothetical protein ABI383_06485 [Acidobacteriaceae bacterium]